MRQENAKATVPLDVVPSVVPNDAPRDFGPEVAFGAKFQIPVARQGGREMPAPRPYFFFFFLKTLYSYSGKLTLFTNLKSKENSNKWINLDYYKYKSSLLTLKFFTQMPCHLQGKSFKSFRYIIVLDDPTRKMGSVLTTPSP